IMGDASASSLEQVSWGLVYPDLVRLLVPFAVPAWLGRGWALERAWDRRKRLTSTLLSQWTEDLHKGDRPAAMFNATVVETGERLVFATFDMAASGLGSRGFAELYPGRHFDIPVTAAVRLSATFPVVTPAARANADLPRSQRYHVVDG